MVMSKRTKMILEVSIIMILVFILIVALFHSAASVMHRRGGKIEPSFGLMLGIIVGIITNLILWFTWGRKQINKV